MLRQPAACNAAGIVENADWVKNDDVLAVRITHGKNRAVERKIEELRESPPGICRLDE